MSYFFAMLFVEVKALALQVLPTHPEHKLLEKEGPVPGQGKPALCY